MSDQKCSQCGDDADGYSQGAFYCSRHMPPEPDTYQPPPEPR